MKLKAQNSKTKRIAYGLVSAITELGVTKQQAKEEGKRIVTSAGTARVYRDLVKGFLEWRIQFRLPQTEQYLPTQMQQYLCDMADMKREQTFLNSAKQALQMTFGVQLQSVESEVPTILSSRAYSIKEVEQTMAFQTDRNSISTELSLWAGLRAHELLTLKPATDMEPSKHREWHDNRFSFFEAFTPYTVEGKGGLRRNVAVPVTLAKRLETYRSKAPAKYIDREIYYDPIYDIGGGQAFSQSFCTASKKALGFSNGAHGLRHTYAQKRLAALKSNGKDTEAALLILSQELGHFRPEIVLAYLR